MKQYVNTVKEFNRIYKEYYSRVLSFAEYMIGNTYVAEGIAIKVFIKIWLKLIAYASIRNEQSFVFTIAKNECLDFLRFKKRSEVHKKRYGYYIENALIECQDEKELMNERYEIMHKLIEQLPDYQKEVMQLVLLGFNNAKIAKELNIKPTSVRQFKWKAMRTIKRIVKDSYSDYC